ncbi:MAG TPA: adenylate/guanylate cyclase domain-containing protein [Labilithrix sp.]
MRSRASECRLILELARVRGRGGWTLGAKWTLAALALAVVPLVVVGWIVQGIQRDGLSRAEKELETAVVDEAAHGVIGALDQASDVAARTKTIFADERIDADARARLIGDVVDRARAVAGVSFFEGKTFVDAVAKEGEETLRIPPQKDGFHVAGGVVRYQTPLDARLTLVVALRADAISARLAEISLTRFQAANRVVLVDESRHVIAPAGRAAPTVLDASGASLPSFATELLLTTEHGDEVATIRTMPAQRWAIVVERPKSEAFAALESARRAFFFVLAAAVAIALAASFVAVRRALRPIASLGELVGRYAKRDFSARSTVTSGDELEDLGASLETMADDLSASEQEIAKRARLEANLRRYLPEEAANAAAADLDLGGARTRVTVLFADVVAFTGFAEKASPERAVAFLNELFTILSEIVFRHGGMVDKFIGDCIMAVFRGDASAALAAAEDMHAFVASNMPRWKKAYDFDVQLGIGVANGDVLLGNLGSASRMEYTVIGDAVNVAARLEMLARPRQTLATKEVVDACVAIAFRSLGEHALRGKAQPVEVFEVVP